MAAPVLQFVGQRSPSLTGIFTDPNTGAAVDLTSATVKFRMRAIGGSALIVDAAAVIVSPALGSVRYDWATVDLATTGFYTGWWHATLASGNTEDAQEFLIEVRDHAGLGTTPALIQLAEVRQLMELDDDSGTLVGMHSLDDKIESYIPAASQAIIQEVGRELAPASAGLTRTFELNLSSYWINLAPYDLRSATAVVLDPSGSAQTLLANVDYYLEPTGADEFGVYTDLVLSRYLAVTPQSLFRFGIVEVAITGNWGFLSVPEIAKKACAVAIKSWLQVEYGAGAYIDPSMPGGAPGGVTTYALPPAALKLLNTLRRSGSVV